MHFSLESTILGIAKALNSNEAEIMTKGQAERAGFSKGEYLKYTAKDNEEVVVRK
jgi:hypothetical protein